MAQLVGFITCPLAAEPAASYRGLLRRQGVRSGSVTERVDSEQVCSIVPRPRGRPPVPPPWPSRARRTASRRSARQDCTTNAAVRARIVTAIMIVRMRNRMFFLRPAVPPDSPDDVGLVPPTIRAANARTALGAAEKSPVTPDLAAHCKQRIEFQPTNQRIKSASQVSPRVMG